jgi:hypothetical protein
VIDRPHCPICGKRILQVMRGAGCCLGPFIRLAQPRN